MMNVNSKIDLSDVPSPFSFWNKVTRVLWGFVWLFMFRPTPKVFYAWRNILLSVFGAKLGGRVYIYPSCRIAMPWKLTVGDNCCLGPNVNCYNIGGVVIGNNTTISQNVHLCSSSHDYTTRNMFQIFAEIVIKDQAWLCADAFIAPGITIGQGAVIGARSVVTKDVEQWNVVCGNPAKYVKQRVMEK